VRDELAAYLARYTSRDIALPWEHPEGGAVTELLVLSNREGRALSADAGFTLRTDTHLMPSSDERTRRAIDGMFSRGREACAITVPSGG
jgi:hypothetical protein